MLWTVMNILFAVFSTSAIVIAIVICCFAVEDIVGRKKHEEETKWMVCPTCKAAGGDPHEAWCRDFKKDRRKLPDDPDYIGV